MKTNSFYGQVKKVTLISGTYKVEYESGKCITYNERKHFIENFIYCHSAKMYGSMKVYQ